ncbi:unnamed protein product [Microthlaspi erraticum]|uniref:WRKY domain-containing protein n=1 Tax=Microthlaspi erraticum TaxID=1685480 RepID=A0A6D2IYK4_9BRAS|nr:unnamed protein product [Microthlaspi erraticum]
MENTGVGMPFSDLGQTRVYQSFSDLSAERYPVGFLDLLGVHQNNSRYALVQTPPMQLPAISSASCEAVTGDEKKRDYEDNDDEEEKEKHKRKMRFKITKLSEEKKVRVPRVSFITKSQVNNLDDDYNWRKYGQKPVRNSTFPRSYYRCTTTWCDVKKRVERSFSDPSNVITTYEGRHTHPRPLIMSKRGNSESNGSASGAHFGLPKLPPHLHHQLFDYNNHQQQQQHEMSFFGRQEKGFDREHVMKKSRTQNLLDGAGLVKDHGLLQDVVSSRVIKKEH